MAVTYFSPVKSDTRKALERLAERQQARRKAEEAPPEAPPETPPGPVLAALLARQQKRKEREKTRGPFMPEGEEGAPEGPAVTGRETPTEVAPSATAQPTQPLSIRERVRQIQLERLRHPGGQAAAVGAGYDWLAKRDPTTILSAAGEAARETPEVLRGLLGPHEPSVAAKGLAKVLPGADAASLDFAMQMASMVVPPLAGGGAAKGAGQVGGKAIRRGGPKAAAPGEVSQPAGPVTPVEAITPPPKPPQPPAAGERPPGTPKRVRYHKGSIDSALDAARRLKADQDLFVFPTAGGFQIGRQPPPFRQRHYRVTPDGDAILVNYEETIAEASQSIMAKKQQLLSARQGSAPAAARAAEVVPEPAPQPAAAGVVRKVAAGQAGRVRLTGAQGEGELRVGAAAQPAPPAAPVTPQGVKEPWQMTTPSELASLKLQLDSGQVPGWQTRLSQHLDFAEQHNVGVEGMSLIRRSHRRLIEGAVQRGELVPAEVLRDYPDLTAQTIKAGPAAPPAQAPKPAAAGAPPTQPKVVPTRRRSNLLTPNQLSDFEVGRDQVVRRGNRTWVVDLKGARAPVEVKSDVLTAEFQANFAKLTPPQQVRMLQEIKRTPYLSAEGKAERLAAFEQPGGQRTAVAAGQAELPIPAARLAPTATPGATLRAGAGGAPLPAPQVAGQVSPASPPRPSAVVGQAAEVKAALTKVPRARVPRAAMPETATEPTIPPGTVELPSVKPPIAPEPMTAPIDVSPPAARPALAPQPVVEGGPPIEPPVPPRPPPPPDAPVTGPSSPLPSFRQPTEELLRLALETKTPEQMLRYAQGEAAKPDRALGWLKQATTPLRALIDPIKSFDPAVQSAYLIRSRQTGAQGQWIQVQARGIQDMFKETFGPATLRGKVIPGLAAKYKGIAPVEQQAYVGTLRHILDFPKDYILTPLQERAVNEWGKILDTDLRFTRVLGIKTGEVEGIYVPHQFRDPDKAITFIGGGKAGGGGGGAARGKPSVLKGRKLTTGEWYKFGADKGLTIETDVMGLLYRRLSAVARLRSDVTFMDGLAAKTGGKRVPPGQTIGMGRKTVQLGGLNWVLPEKLAKEAQSVLSPPPIAADEAAINAVVNNLKGVLLNLDFSIGGLRQGLLGFMGDPIGAVRAYSRAWHMLTTPEGQALNLVHNGERLTYWAEHGSQFKYSPLDLPISGQGEKRMFFERIPGVGWLNDVQFNVLMPNLKMAINERNLSTLRAVQESRGIAGLLHKMPGLGPYIKKLGGDIYSMTEDQLAVIAADAGNNWLGGLEVAGTRVGRINAARNLLLLTEGWTRAQLGTLINSTKMGPKGILARRLIMQEVAIGTGIATIISIATGQEVNLDPRSDGFGKIKISSVGYVSVLPHVPLLRATARVVGGVPAGEYGSDASPLGQRLGAALRWSDARQGQVPRILTDLAKGTDYYGRRINKKALYLAKSMMPILVSNITESIQRGESVWAIAGQAAIGFGGANIAPIPLTEELGAIAERMGIAKGRPWSALSPSEKAVIEHTEEARTLRDRRQGGIVSYEEGRAKTEDEYDVQLLRDNAVTAGTLNGRPYSYKDWMQDYYEARRDSTIRKETTRRLLRQSFPKPRTAEEQALSSYYDLMDTFRLPGGQFDSAEWARAKEAYLAGLVPAMRQYVENNQNVNATPLVKVFLADMKALQPYWDAGRSVRIGDSRVAVEWEAYQRAGKVQRAMMERSSANIKNLKRMEGEQRERLRVTSPEIDRLLVKWYGFRPRTKAGAAEWNRQAQPAPVEAR